MCEEYDQNRRDFIKLMEAKASFREDELMEEFLRGRKSAWVGAHETPRELVQALAESGVLKYKCGRYSLSGRII